MSLILGGPAGKTVETFTPDSLLIGGEIKTISAEMARATAASGTTFAARGALLSLDANGRYRVLDSSATDIVITATGGGDVVINALSSGTDLDRAFTLADPPIPGTVSLVTTVDASGDTKHDFGTDNGLGVGVGPSGSWFTIDYNTGKGVAHMDAAPADGDDLKAAYQHRNVLAAYVAGETLDPKALPGAILVEDILTADVNTTSSFKTTPMYVSGKFRSSEMRGYSSGYEAHLRSIGIWVE